MWKEKIHFGRLARRLAFWLLALCVMVLFTGFQIWLQGIAGDWMATTVLVVSVAIELLLLARISDLLF